MWNNQDAAVAAAHSVDPDRWWTAFGAVIDRIAPRFSRYEPLRHAAGLMLGMLAGLDRKNCWTIAEHRGDLTPDGLQHLLARARWDADAVRDDLRDYVVEAFGDQQAVLVVDETGDVKKGTATVGVHANRGGALLQVTCFINHQHPGRVTEGLHDVGPQVVPYCVGFPLRPGQQCCNPSGVASPRCSAIVQQFFRSSPDNIPNISPAARPAGSYRENRGAIRSISAPNSSHQKPGSMLCAAASAASCCST